MANAFERRLFGDTRTRIHWRDCSLDDGSRSVRGRPPKRPSRCLTIRSRGTHQFRRRRLPNGLSAAVRIVFRVSNARAYVFSTADRMEWKLTTGLDFHFQIWVPFFFKNKNHDFRCRGFICMRCGRCHWCRQPADRQRVDSTPVRCAIQLPQRRLV